jgi:hypothetical protein
VNVIQILHHEVNVVMLKLEIMFHILSGEKFGITVKISFNTNHSGIKIGQKCNL